MSPDAAIKTWRRCRAMSDPSISKAATEVGRAPVAGGRISRKFRELAETGELGLVAYITAGDPSLDATEKIVLGAAEAGADVNRTGRAVQRSCCRWANDSARERTSSAGGNHACGRYRSRAADSFADGCAAGAFQLFQSDFADGPREICRQLLRQRRGWSSRDGLDARRSW